jgi:fido (protein-threonine AMPylation protein)
MGLSYLPKQGQTPLDPEHLSGLRLVGVTTKVQLDELEQLNIQSAMTWLIRNPPKHDSLLKEKFIKSLHKRMFGVAVSARGFSRRFRRQHPLEPPE